MSSTRAFLFSLYNRQDGYQPIQYKLTGDHNDEAMLGLATYGPTFGSGKDLYIANLASTNDNSYTKPKTFQTPKGCVKGTNCGFLAGFPTFIPDDVEVFYYTSQTSKS